MNTLREKLTRCPWWTSRTRRASANSSGAVDGAINPVIQDSSAGMSEGRTSVIPPLGASAAGALGTVWRMFESDVEGILRRHRLILSADGRGGCRSICANRRGRHPRRVRLETGWDANECIAGVVRLATDIPAKYSSLLYLTYVDGVA